MKLSKNILLLSIILIFNTSFGQSALTKATVNLRTTPDYYSNVLIVIPKISAISINNCENGWCSVSYSGINGYVRESYIRKPPSENRNSSNVKYYTNSSGERVQSPTHYDSVPAGATAQCHDRTYSFSQSRRGTCSHHGGVKRWL